MKTSSGVNTIKSQASTKKPTRILVEARMKPLINEDSDEEYLQPLTQKVNISIAEDAAILSEAVNKKIALQRRGSRSAVRKFTKTQKA